MQSKLYLILIFPLIMLIATDSYANFAEDPDSSSQIHNHDINHFSPFLFIGGQTLVAKLKYDFDLSQERSHTSYMVDYTGVGFEIGTGIRYRNLGLFVTGGYHFLNYWSGEHKISKRTLNGKLYEEVLITEHIFPNNLFFGSVGLNYRIKFSQNMQLNPFIMAKRWKYPENRFYPSTNNKDEFYTLKDNYAYGLGLSFKGKLPSNSALGLKVCFLKNQFNPAGYFESLKAENLKVSNNSVEITATYDFDFSGYRIGIMNHQFSFYE